MMGRAGGGCVAHRFNSAATPPGRPALVDFGIEGAAGESTAAGGIPAALEADSDGLDAAPAGGGGGGGGGGRDCAGRGFACNDELAVCAVKVL